MGLRVGVQRIATAVRTLGWAFVAILAVGGITGLVLDVRDVERRAAALRAQAPAEPRGARDTASGKVDLSRLSDEELLAAAGLKPKDAQQHPLPAWQRAPIVEPSSSERGPWQDYQASSGTGAYRLLPDEGPANPFDDLIPKRSEAEISALVEKERDEAIRRWLVAALALFAAAGIGLSIAYGIAWIIDGFAASA